MHTLTALRLRRDTPRQVMHRHGPVALLLLLLLGLPLQASAQQWHQHPYWPTDNDIPVSGRPVPELAWVDAEMRDFMQQRSIPGGVFGVMRNGRIVYLRGFGHDFNRNPLPENTPFLLASVSKTITAAAARHLIATGAIGLDDFVFDRDQVEGGVTVGGILPANPYSAQDWEDSRVDEIRLTHLIHHRSGWYVGVNGVIEDYAFYDRPCAEQLAVSSPPGPTNKIRCILGKALGFRPGERAEYSNINTLLLGEVVKHVSGLSLEEYVRRHVMRWQIEIPETEIFGGRSFRSWQNPREPYYKTLNAHPDSATGPWMVPNVFDGVGGATVERPYGGYDIETSVPYGGFVASAAAMLDFANHYDLRYSEDPDSSFGMPLGAAPLGWAGGHNGSLDGFESIIFQQDLDADRRFRFFVAFNARSNSPSFFDSHWPTTFLNRVRSGLVSPTQAWSDIRSDGFWTQPGAELIAGVGGYHTPFRGFQRALDRTTRGSRIRLKAGSQGWTGVLDRPMLIDAPEGVVTLGAQ
jgi:CubicO group peptidase (beta-lactamase class C family)